MKSKLLSLVAFLLLSSTLFFVACKKDIDATVPGPTPNPTDGFTIPVATPVTGSVSGLVVNENNTPVASAAVSYGGTVYQTDSRGVFNIQHVVLDKYVSTVTVDMPGYFKAIRAFSANATRNYVSIKLIPKTLAGTVSASTGGSISLANGTTMTFQSAGMVVKSTGASYTGTVKVYASYIDPTSSDFSSRVPGSMMGQDATKMYVLQSTGMIAVDLESSTGEPLQLVAGKDASVKLPIPSTLLSKAPATIDTWSLDDRGVWKKEGTATKNGNFYEMTVSHFSFWNCDVPANAIYLTLHVHDQNNQVLEDAVVLLTIPGSTTWWATTYGYTDAQGNVSGLVPSNLGLEMKVFPGVGSCTNPINTQNIGPFSSDTTVDVTAPLTSSQVLTVSGTANDCNNQPIQNGTAIIYSGPYSTNYANIVNGIYTANIIHCDPISSIEVTIIADSTLAQANSGTVAVTGNSVAVPLLTACTLNPSAVFNFSGCQAGGYYTAGIQLNSTNAIYVTVQVQSPGTYNITTGTPINGISFSATGIFTAAGSQTVVLQGTGTPVNSGNFVYSTQSGPIVGCVAQVIVYPVAPAPAVFSLGGPGACPNVFVSGDYVAGFPLTSSNTITLMVTVTSPGSYSISTGNPVNGMSFYDSGYFNNAGVQTVVLLGTGVPQVAGTSTITPEASGVPGCTVAINTVNTGSNADFTFEGAPGNCVGAVLSGVYQAGTPLNGQNSVTLQVNVASVGTYAITTNSTNGVSFGASGIFIATGPQLVTLMGSGTPTVAGINTYIPDSGISTGCVFTVTTN